MDNKLKIGIDINGTRMDNKLKIGIDINGTGLDNKLKIGIDSSLLKATIYIYINYVLSSQNIRSVPIVPTSRQMLFEQIMRVHCKNHTNYTGLTKLRQRAKFLYVAAGSTLVTARL